MASPSTRYPLPSWPREAYPFEPAHGYFRRLAAANAQVSVRTLGSYVGVNGRNFDREELLEFCSRFPSKGIENLQRSTPQIEGSLVIMNGEIISRTKDYTPSGHTLLHVSTCPTGKLIIASAQANRAAASAWLELLTKRQDDVCEMWPQALVTRASDSIRFEQIFAVGTAGTTGQLHHVARLIDQIATNLRMLRLTEKAAA